MDTLKQTLSMDKHHHPVYFQAQSGDAVTKSDSTRLQAGILYIGGAGNVNVRTALGIDLVFVGVPAGTFLPIVVDMVYSTSTTASNILILR